jgi:hypothetical protein
MHLSNSAAKLRTTNAAYLRSSYKNQKERKFYTNTSDFLHKSDNDFHAFRASCTPFVQKGWSYLHIDESEIRYSLLLHL